MSGFVCSNVGSGSVNVFKQREETKIKAILILITVNFHTFSVAISTNIHRIWGIESDSIVNLNVLWINFTRTFSFTDLSCAKI